MAKANMELIRALLNKEINEQTKTAQLDKISMVEKKYNTIIKQIPYYTNIEKIQLNIIIKILSSRN